VIFMMLNPTNEELDLEKKIEACKNEEEKKKLEEELSKLVHKRFEEIKNSPFC